MDLKPNPNNPRTISKEAFEKLKDKIKRNPDGLDAHKIVHKDGIIIAGNQRWRALQDLGIELKDEWFKDVSGWTDDQIREWLITSNISDGDWDWEILANEWDRSELEEWGLDLPDSWNEEQEVEEDETPEVEDDPVSELGKIYQLGRHRVMCGDSTKDTDKLFDTATIAFTSPPYNVGHNLGYDNDNKYNEYKDDNPEYLDLLNEFNAVALNKCKYSFVNLQFLAGNKRQIVQWLADNNDNFCDIAFWKKTQVQPAMANNVMNSQVECIFIFGGNGSRAINTGNFRGNVSNFIETLSASTTNENSDIHAATYPVEFVGHFINNFTQKGDSVYDAFIGTGTTLIACEQTDRICYGMELDEKYLDVIRKRWAKYVYPDRWEKEWEILTPAIEKL